MLKETDVLKVAELARLQLSSDEIKKYTKQLEKVLELFEKINSLDLEGIEETSQVSGLASVCGVDDVVNDARSRPTGHDALFSNVPQKDSDSILVPKIIKR